MSKNNKDVIKSSKQFLAYERVCLFKLYFNKFLSLTTPLNEKHNHTLGFGISILSFPHKIDALVW
jgi:hypothetical protein